MRAAVAAERTGGPEPAGTVRFTFDGSSYSARTGQTVAAALLASGVLALRRSAADGTPRGLFCAMGACQECVVLVDGRPVEACRLPARNGLVVGRAG